MAKQADDILDNLNYIHTKNRTVSLVSHYQGVSISAVGSIVEISRRNKRVTISAEQSSSVPFLQGTVVSINNELFPSPVDAVVTRVNFLRKTMDLSDFQYSQDSLGRRSHSRIQPQEDIMVEVVSESGTAHTFRMNDISVIGVSVTGDDGSLESFYEREKPVNLKFKLPFSEQNGGVALNLDASVAYAIPLDDGTKIQIGFQVSAAEPDQAVIRQYMFDSQTEILRSLKEIK